MSTATPTEGFSERPLPQSGEAEQAVLGAMLQDKDAIVTARMELSGPEDFYAAKHELIYRTILSLFDHGKPVDLLTVQDALNRPLRDDETQTRLQSIGGLTYLTTIVSRVPSTVNTQAYAQIVAAKATLRRQIMAGLRIADRAREADRDSEDLTEAVAAAKADAEAELRKVTTPGQKDGLQSIGGIVDRAKAKLATMGQRDPNRLEFGLREFDVFAWKRAEVLAIHAASGNGKSTLGRQIALNLAKRGQATPFFALETFKEQMDDCLIAAEGRLSLHRIRNMDREPLSAEEQRRMAEAAERIEALRDKLYFDHVPMQRFDEVRAKVLRAAMKLGDVACFIIDYTDLLEKVGKERHEQMLIDLHYQAKALAEEVNALAILVDQAPTEMLRRADPTPTIFDFEYARGIPKACDHCIGLVIPDNCRESQIGKTHITPAFPVPKGDSITYNDHRLQNVMIAAYTKGRFAKAGYLLPLYHHGPSGFIGNLARRPWDSPGDMPGFEGPASPIEQCPKPQQRTLWTPEPEDGWE